jgi:formylglycine-generating enzyme required for sulfatase activity
VGLKAANRFGIYDMHGNVWEWCEDKVDWAFYGKPNARETDPVSNEGSDSLRVIRGGSWHNDAWLCRSAFRNFQSASNSHGVDIGFRPAYWLP